MIHRYHWALGIVGAMLCSGTLSWASSGRTSSPWWSYRGDFFQGQQVPDPVHPGQEGGQVQIWAQQDGLHWGVSAAEHGPLCRVCHFIFRFWGWFIKSEMSNIWTLIVGSVELSPCVQTLEWIYQRPCLQEKGGEDGRWRWESSGKGCPQLRLFHLMNLLGGGNQSAMGQKPSCSTWLCPRLDSLQENVGENIPPQGYVET